MNFSSLGAARRSDLGGAGRFSLAGQSQLLRVPRHVIRAAVACASVVRSLFNKSRPLPFDCYEQPFGDYPYVNHFLNPSHVHNNGDARWKTHSQNVATYREHRAEKFGPLNAENFGDQR